MSEFNEKSVSEIDVSTNADFTIFTMSLIWLAVIFLVPVLMDYGGVPEKISSYIYLFFSKVCHQQDERSFHLLDHKLGVCSRCTLIYAGFFLGTALYPLKYSLSNSNTPALWILITAVIILFADVALDSAGISANTFSSRSVTGFIIGFVLPLYLIPGFVKFFSEVFTFLRNKVST